MRKTAMWCTLVSKYTLKVNLMRSTNLIVQQISFKTTEYKKKTMKARISKSNACKSYFHLRYIRNISLTISYFQIEWRPVKRPR